MDDDVNDDGYGTTDDDIDGDCDGAMDGCHRLDAARRDNEPTTARQGHGVKRRRRWREMRGGEAATQQSPDNVTGKMAGGDGEERDDAPRAHP